MTCLPNISANNKTSFLSEMVLLYSTYSLFYAVNDCLAQKKVKP